MIVLGVQSEAKVRENRGRNWKGSKSKERDKKDPGEASVQDGAA